MQQKDIYLADLNPVLGSEQGGLRPVVIISGESMNDNIGVVIICPISSKIKQYQGCVIIKKNKENNLDNDSEIITFHIRAISKKRLISKIGVISDSELNEVMNGLNDVLKY